MSRKRNVTGDFLDYFESLTSQTATDMLLDEIQRLARRKGITLRYFRRVSAAKPNGRAVEVRPRRVETGEAGLGVVAVGGTINEAP
jgi:hypothetical protein